MGNVLATVSDRKLPKSSESGLAIIGFKADVRSASDYYPFGMMMPGRSYSSGDYRFGFNGMELDNEIKGTGNSYDFGARIYDSRVGRWLSLDPLANKYPNQTPYHFTGNNPILFVDYDGKDYGVEIQNESKTIIIKSTIYTAKSDYLAAQTAVNHWVNQNGNFQVEVKTVVKKGFLGIGRETKTEVYDICFEIDVISKETKNKAEAAFYNDHSGIANIYKLHSVNFKRPDLTTPDGAKVRGYTSTAPDASPPKGSSKINVVDTHQAKVFKTGSHEIGHTLGIPHWNIGLMKDGSNRKRNEDFITKRMINRILSNVKITKKKIFSRGGNSDNAADFEDHAKAKLIGDNRIKGKTKVITKN